MDTRRKLKSVLNNLKKTQIKIVRLKKILKLTQRRTQNKIIYLIKKLNKKKKKKIIYNNIFDSEKKNLKTKK